MSKRVIFITGTDTGVGKTVLTALLTRHLQERGVRVAALKPISSGNRDDARALRAALDGALTLDEINPWHFRAPLAPVLSARSEGKRVRLVEVVAHARTIAKRFDVTLVEGAGGLLSPLGEDFDSRDLIRALRATPIVVCLNRLGAVNQALLVLAGLPKSVSRRAPVVLMSPQRPDSSCLTNPLLLAERIGAKRVFAIPWITEINRTTKTLGSRKVRRVLDGLAQLVVPGSVPESSQRSP